MKKEKQHGTIEVTATRKGYYNNRRIQPGEVFDISDEKFEEDVKDKDGNVLRKKGDVKAFSDAWMEKGDKADDISYEQPHSFTDQTIPKPSIAETGPNEVTLDPRHSGNAEDKGLLKGAAQQKKK